MRLEYRFVERNGWPVMSNQESILSLVDIMLGQIVCIQNCEKFLSTATALDRPTSLMVSSNTSPAVENQQSPTECPDPDPVKRKKSIKPRLDFFY